MKYYLFKKLQLIGAIFFTKIGDEHRFWFLYSCFLPLSSFIRCRLLGLEVDGVEIVMLGFETRFVEVGMFVFETFVFETRFVEVNTFVCETFVFGFRLVKEEEK